MRVLGLLLVCLSVFWSACTRTSGLPLPGSDQYRSLCTAFYLGLTALQSGEDVNARQGLTRATEIAPGEPAGWADLGLLQFRQQDYDGAYGSIGKAQALAPDNSRIEALLGVIESRRGKASETLAHLKHAVELDPGNLKALYGLAQETERQNSESSDAQAQQLLTRIIAAKPNNIAVLIDLVRLSAKRNNAAELRLAIAGLQKSAGLWPDSAREQLTSLEKEANSPNIRPAAIQAQFLRNVLVRVPAYRQSLDEVRTPVTSAGEPFLKFLKLPSPSSEPSSPDAATHFEMSEAGMPDKRVEWIGEFVPDDQHGAQMIWADDECLHLPNGTSLPFTKVSGSEAALARNAILPADLNYDFKTDLVIATGDGLRFYQQTNEGHFVDVTAATKLTPAILKGAYNGAWAFDIDLDGDLDVVLGVRSGPPIALRNNGDASYTPIEPFRGVDGLTAFVRADIDGDGDPDVALLDGRGRLKVFINERLGDYRERTVPAELNREALNLAAADLDGDGLPDFVVEQAGYRVLRLSDRLAGREWNVAELLAAHAPAVNTAVHSLLVADLDNNGALDVIVDDQVFLSDGRKFTPAARPLNANAVAVADPDVAGRQNLIGLNAESRAVRLLNRGSKNYSWQTIRPKAATTRGDQRINSFGIGGEIEVRSELLTQKQIIDAPVVHFGFGNHPTAEFARIVWPNGLIQTEFALKANQTLLAEQRLKGSCPLLFAWNGHAMQFVKDVGPMAAALGAHDGTGRFADISQTEEWFKISGNQLKPQNGSYDLRVTDEYWETYYVDHYGLLAIDHPAGTQIFADERVAVPAVPLRFYVTGPLNTFASARDDGDRNVSELVKDADGRYLNDFELGAYQGIAKDHWVELELPTTAPRSGPLYLIAQGWLHPWDDGGLVAVNQGTQAKPEDLSIQTPDRQGRWTTVQRSLGVPAGREKTVVLDLGKVFQPGAPRRLRLRTNLEIYWDKLAWAQGLPGNSVNSIHLPLAGAELCHRGFSEVKRAEPLGPEVPIYDRVAESGEKWRGLEGFYTRYGDVLPLLQTVDDRLALVSGGDELRLRFIAVSAPPLGWSRDFIFVGDGWLKEGDYSFRYSSTLLPLPYHGMKTYTGQQSSLASEKTYQRHPADWRNFHTRYIAPESASAALWK